MELPRTDASSVGPARGAERARPLTQSLEAQALLDGEVDAIFHKGSRGLELADALGAKVVFDLGAHPDPNVRVNNGSPRTLTVDEGLIERDSSLVVRLLKRVLLAGRWAAEHPREAVAYVARETRSSEAAVTRAYGSDVNHHLRTDLEESSIVALGDFTDFLHRWQFIPEGVDVRAWIDPRPLAQAVQELGGRGARRDPDPAARRRLSRASPGLERRRIVMSAAIGSSPGPSEGPAPPAKSSVEQSSPSLTRTKTRVPDAPIDAMFVDRWSHRALLPRSIPADDLRALFEAARWAPSASNVQPWLFVYNDDEETLARARGLLNPRNRVWAEKAPLLVFVFARRIHHETGRPLRTGAFDTGAAWLSLALQAHKLGLSTRAMGGINHELAYELFGVPREQYESMAAIAIGYPGRGPICRPRSPSARCRAPVGTRARSCSRDGINRRSRPPRAARTVRTVRTVDGGRAMNSGINPRTLTRLEVAIILAISIAGHTALAVQVTRTRKTPEPVAQTVSIEMVARAD